MTQPSTSSSEKPQTPRPAKPGAAYKDTLNLPQTSFPMEAKLVQNEPARLKTWDETRLYEKVLAARANSPKWILHDGPPFANADIHIGHVINHVLKDVVIRFRTMQGYLSPYIPGWDCHGLPIEHMIQQQLGPKIRTMPPQEIRQLCHAHAQKYIDVQRAQVKRLGMLGEWENPYVTMSPKYEASQLEVFARFVQAGLVFKKLRPVPWSVANRTALAEDSVELEYRDVDDPSIYIEFPATNPGQVKGLFDARLDGPVAFLVWTTTPWTLPANLAIAVHPEHQYVAVKYARGGKVRLGIVVSDLLERVFKGRASIESHEVVGRPVKGADLVAANVEYQHPFVDDRRGKILPAMYVTTTDGTGLVHTAPGHGMEDYVTGQTHGLPVYSPVLPDGRFDDTVPEFIRGKTVWEANPLVIDRLRQADVLFDQQTIRHSYPHDWRSKTPVIQRAAEQWFLAVDKAYVAADEPQGTPRRTLRERAQHAIANDVKWVPEWGKRRIGGMVEVRPDWSISRQRFWGLPIPVFYNAAGEPLLTPESVRAVARHFREHGSDIWYTWSPSELLGSDFVYPPGFNKDELRKEQDTFDVGFDSGTSWHAVLYGNSRMDFPCEMYLEGSDQHRLWFQLSLLASLGATGRPPFKEVLTHGFVVKPDGTKVSKSDKEYVTATKEIETHGADLLRLWCCSVDYENDIPASPQAIREFGDKYRKIRNTLRYLLSNLYDFDPRRDAQTVPQNSLDGWAVAQLDELIVEATREYEAYQFHRVFRLLHDFCAVQISAIYGNAMKDRLYCEAPDSPLRRRAQTVMYRMVVALTKLLAPMIVFTADEAWEYIQHKPDEDKDLGSVHLALLPKPSGQTISDEQREEWKLLMDLRDQALAQIDKLTRQIGKYKALDAEVIYRVDDDALRRRLQAYGPDLEDLVGAGCWSFAEKGTQGAAVSVEVIDRRETYKACARSWKRRPDVGQDPEYPDLTLRDAAAVRARRKT